MLFKYLMNVKDLKKQLEKISDLKKNNNYEKYSLKELQSLPTFNGLCELKFKNFIFYMINISSDDAVPLKFLWRDKYENKSLSLWYDITRGDGYFFDIGAHTGIYSIVGNLNNKKNKIVSVEPYYLNYSRLLSNLKINNILSNNCILAAASNSEGVGKFSIKTNPSYHTSGGKLSEDGSFSVSKIKIDNFKLDKKISGIKIDTEGHELNVLEGAKNSLIENKPDIIFEINEICFDNCLNLLKPMGYKFYLIDESKDTFIEITKFKQDLLRSEGVNCYATVR